MFNSQFIRSTLHWCLIAAFLLALAVGMTQDVNACGTSCCWHWFWGYKSSCSVFCDGICDSSCSCKSCSATCRDDQVLPIEGGS